MLSAGTATMGTARRRHAGRPSAGMRRADHRRLFRRSRRSRLCPAWPTSAIRSPRSMPTANIVIAKPPAPAAASSLHSDRADTLRDPRSIHLSRARRSARSHLRRSVVEISRDRVRVAGRAQAGARTLKATVCIDGGVLGEAEISYACSNANARATLAAETVLERTCARRAPELAVRVDAIGLVSVFGDNAVAFARAINAPDDIRLRFAAAVGQRRASRAAARRGRVALLRRSRPAAPVCGARLTPRLASASCLIERDSRHAARHSCLRGSA